MPGQWVSKEGAGAHAGRLSDGGEVVAALQGHHHPPLCQPAQLVRHIAVHLRTKAENTEIQNQPSPAKLPPSK